MNNYFSVYLIYLIVALIYISGKQSSCQRMEKPMVSLVEELLDGYTKPSSSNLYDQKFGIGLEANGVVEPLRILPQVALGSGYLRPWRKLAAEKSGVSAIQNGNDEFYITLDVEQFKLEELRVTVNGGYIVVHGKHKERADEHGLVSRQFTRKFKMPKDVDESTITSTLSSDGVLSIKAGMKALPERKGREIVISRKNEPAVKKKCDSTRH